MLQQLNKGTKQQKEEAQTRGKMQQRIRKIHDFYCQKRVDPSPPKEALKISLKLGKRPSMDESVGV